MKNGLNCSLIVTILSQAMDCGPIIPLGAPPHSPVLTGLYSPSYLSACSASLAL